MMPALLSAARKAIASLALPEGLVLLAVAVALRFRSVQQPLENLADVIAVAVLAGGVLLAWRFHRTRLLFAFVILLLADRSLVSFGGGGLLLGAVAFLLPLNFLALSLIPERGLFTPMGGLRFALIAVQVSFLVVIYWGDLEGIAGLFEMSPLPDAWFGWTPLKQPALVSFVGVVALVATGAIQRSGGIARGFLWALVASYLALTADSDPLRTIFFAAAGLVLLVTIVESSYSMAYRDGLTGLPARRALNEAIANIRGKYAVAMIDVDRFKKFNDQYGHDIGDQVLRMVAARVEKVGGGGKPFRYGGEEFAVLFPGRSVDDAEPFLEKLRGAIEKSKFTLRGRGRPRRKPTKPKPKKKNRRRRVKITVSIGAADRQDRDSSAHDVIKAADEALYEAKSKGRNRVVI